MRLPPEVFHHTDHLFKHHMCWHLARSPAGGSIRALIEPHLSAELRPIADLETPGCGRQFLVFHREMVRIFKFICIETKYEFVPWGPKLPGWVEELFANSSEHGPDFLPLAYAEIDERIATGSDDDLGNFVEATGLSVGVPGRGVHNAVHALISHYEATKFGTAAVAGAEMTPFLNSHNNEHFWGLHGWIDDLYAQWQVGQGETPDLSPLDPTGTSHHHVPSCTGSPAPVPHHEIEAAMKDLRRRLSPRPAART